MYTRIVHLNCTYKNCKNHKIEKNHEKIKSQKLNFWKFEIEIRKWSKAWNWTVQFIKNQNYFSLRLSYCRSTPRLIRKVFKLMPNPRLLIGCSRASLIGCQISINLINWKSLIAITIHLCTSNGTKLPTFSATVFDCIIFRATLFPKLKLSFKSITIFGLFAVL